MKTLLIIASIVVLLVIYSCLVMASRCSRDEEEAHMNENKIKREYRGE